MAMCREKTPSAVGESTRIEEKSRESRLYRPFRANLSRSTAGSSYERRGTFQTERLRTTVDERKRRPWNMNGVMSGGPHVQITRRGSFKKNLITARERFTKEEGKTDISAGFRPSPAARGAGGGDSLGGRTMSGEKKVGKKHSVGKKKRRRCGSHHLQVAKTSEPNCQVKIKSGNPARGEISKGTGRRPEKTVNCRIRPRQEKASMEEDACPPRKKGNAHFCE